MSMADTRRPRRRSDHVRGPRRYRRGTQRRTAASNAATISERRSSSRASTVAEATHAICSSVTLLGVSTAKRAATASSASAAQRRRLPSSGGHGHSRGGRWFDHLRLGGCRRGRLRLRVAAACRDRKHSDSYYYKEKAFHTRIIETNRKIAVPAPGLSAASTPKPS